MHVLDTEANKRIEKTDDESIPVPRSTKVSSICLNIPAAGLGSRPASIVSTSTSDEGGFNEPYPEIKAKLKPHENSYQITNESVNDNTECFENTHEIDEDISRLPIIINDDNQSKTMDAVSDSVEPLYAVPYKPNKHKNIVKEQPSVCSQKSIDSDIMYDNKNISDIILTQLDSQDSFEKSNEDNPDSTLYNSNSSKDSEVNYY